MDGGTERGTERGTSRGRGREGGGEGEREREKGKRERDSSMCCNESGIMLLEWKVGKQEKARAKLLLTKIFCALSTTMNADL